MVYKVARAISDEVRSKVYQTKIMCMHVLQYLDVLLLLSSYRIIIMSQ